MKQITKLLMITAFLFTGFILLLVLAIPEDTALVQTIAQITPEQISHGRDILKQNDPRKLPNNSISKANFTQADLDLAINYIANQYSNGSANLLIESGWAYIEASFNLPKNPFGRFLNIKLELKQADKLPIVSYLSVGQLKIPAELTNYLLNGLISSSKWQVFADRVINCQFQPGQLAINYIWQNGSGLHSQFTDALLSSADQHRIEFYQQYLRQLSLAGNQPLNLTDLLQPLFAEVEHRAGDKHSNAIEESRAVILVLTFYLVGIDLQKIIPAAQDWPAPVHRSVLINDREDFPKHYMVSALLAAYAGTPLADAVGTYKEVEDSHGGSGFSFNDIAADRAGTRMGELIINPTRSQKIQRFLSKAGQAEIMPVTIDLPEFMSELEFIRRFGGLHSDAYQQMIKDIDHRVASLAINQN